MLTAFCTFRFGDRPMTKCNHVASSGNGTFICNLEEGHQGLHQETVKLREGSSRTNWGDDGRAPHATRDSKRLQESSKRK